MQRDEKAKVPELVQWLDSYREKNTEHVWLGTLACASQAVRSVVLGDKPNRVLAIYDTAEPTNQAHAEIFQTEHVIDESDQIELRKELLQRFCNGVLTIPASYRSGALLDMN